VRLANRTKYPDDAPNTCTWLLAGVARYAPYVGCIYAVPSHQNFGSTVLSAIAPSVYRVISDTGFGFSFMYISVGEDHVIHVSPIAERSYPR
jgi:hypothetical protein